MNKKLIIFQLCGIFVIFFIFYFSFKFIFSAIDKYNISTIKKQIIFSLSDELAEGNYLKLGYIFSKLEREGIISAAELIEINNKEKNIIYKSSFEDLNNYLDKIDCDSTKTNDLIKRINNETILITNLSYNSKENTCNILFIKHKPSKEIKNLYFKNITLFSFFLLLSITVLLVFSNLFYKNYLKFELEKQKILYEKEVEIGRISIQVAHDIRSPVAALRNIVLETNIADEKKQIITDAIERINTIADDLLKRYRNKNTRTEYPPRSNNPDEKGILKLDEILNKLVLEKREEYPDVEFKLKTESNISLNCDNKELMRAISNLINNSVEAKANQIELNLYRTEDKIILRIKDNGKGMPKDIIQKVGEKGFSYGKDKGNGLGIYHAKRFSERLGGEFNINSEINKGTEIIISIPLKSEKTVILLDDDPLVIKNWEIKSKNKGINLITFNNPERFLKEIDKFPKESEIYLDSELDNNINGEEIAKELYKRGFRNIYLETGYNKDHFRDIKYIKDIKSKDPPF